MRKFKDAQGSVRVKTPPHGSVRIRSMFSNFRIKNAFYTFEYPHITFNVPAIYTRITHLSTIPTLFCYEMILVKLGLNYSSYILSK